MLALVQPLDTTTPANAALESILAELYANVVRCQNMKDMAGVLGCVHQQSVGRFFIKQLLEPQFDHFTLQFTLLSHTYGGTDGEYVYYRARVKMERIAGADFKDAITENLVLYKQEQGEWKVWNRLLLTMVPA